MDIFDDVLQSLQVFEREVGQGAIEDALNALTSAQESAISSREADEASAAESIENKKLEELAIRTRRYGHHPSILGDIRRLPEEKQGRFFEILESMPPVKRKKQDFVSNIANTLFRAGEDISLSLESFGTNVLGGAPIPFTDIKLFNLGKELSPEKGLALRNRLTKIAQGQNPIKSISSGVPGFLERNFYTAVGLTPDVAASAISSTTAGPAGTLAYWTARISGNMFLELEAAGVPRWAARVGSVLTALPSAAVEVAQFSQIKKFFSGPVKSSANQIVTKGVISALKKLGIAGTKSVSIQVGQEFVQELIEGTGRGLTEQYAGVGKGVVPKQIILDAFRVAKDSAVPLMMLMLPGSAAHLGAAPQTSEEAAREVASIASESLRDSVAELRDLADNPETKEKLDPDRIVQEALRPDDTAGDELNEFIENPSRKNAAKSGLKEEINKRLSEDPSMSPAEVRRQIRDELIQEKEDGRPRETQGQEVEREVEPQDIAPERPQVAEEGAEGEVDSGGVLTQEALEESFPGARVRSMGKIGEFGVTLPNGYFQIVRQGDREVLRRLFDRAQRFEDIGEEIPPVTDEDIKSVFPGSRVSINDEGARIVELSGGSAIEIRDTAKITVNRANAERSRGKPFTEEEWARIERIGAAGSFELRTEDGEFTSGIGLIQLAAGLSNKETLRHEAIHFARAAELYKPGEWEALVAKYAANATSEKNAEELVARAMQEGVAPAGLLKSLRLWFSRLLNKFGLGKINAEDVAAVFGTEAFFGRSRPIDSPARATEEFSIPEDFPRKKTIRGKEVTEIAEGITVGPKGRPKRAVLTETDEARDLFNIVNESMFVQGLPGIRQRVVAAKIAKEKLTKDYDGERTKIIDRMRKGPAGLTEDETIMTKTIIEKESHEALRDDDTDKMRDMEHMTFGLIEDRTEKARALGLRDPKKTPAERNADMLSEVILTPSQNAMRRIKRFREKGNAEKESAEWEKWAKERTKILQDLDNAGIRVDDLVNLGKNPDATAKAISIARIRKADTWDAFYEFWQQALLGGTLTHATNIISTAAFMAQVQFAERFTEAIGNMVLKRLTGKESENLATIGEFKHVLRGIMPGIMRGQWIAAKAWDSEKPELSTFLFGKEKGGKEKFKEERGVAIPGKFGRWVRGMGWRPLLTGDEFLKSIATYTDAGARAHRIAKSEGLSGKEMSERIRKLTEDKTSEVWSPAFEESLVQSFQKSSTVIGESIVKTGLSIRNMGEDLGIRPMRWVVPFVTTLGNLAEQGILRLPMVGLGAEVLNAAVKDDWSRIPGALNRQVWGFAALAIIAYSNDEDDPWITGAEPESDWRKRTSSHRQYQPQSITVAGVQFSYRRIEPLSTILATLVDAVNAAKTAVKSPSAAFKQLFATSKNLILNKTYMAGVSDMVKVAEAKDLKSAERWASNFVASWMPNLFKGFSRASQPVFAERKMWGEGPDSWSRLFRRTLQKMEVLPFLVDQPKIDLWGREAKRPGAPFFSNPQTDWAYRVLVPIKARRVNVFVGDRVLFAWNNDHPDDLRNPVTPDPSFMDNIGKRHFMTDEQYTKFLKLRGGLAKGLVETEEFDAEKPKLADVNTISKHLSSATSLAKKILRREFLGGEKSDFNLDELIEKEFARNIGSALYRLTAREIKKDKKESEQDFEDRVERRESLKAQMQSRLRRLNQDQALEALKSYAKSRGFSTFSNNFRKRKILLRDLIR